ncbi:MAG: DUF2141 domain-containing protein [Alphaproteobacteria bacterium]|nr:DUF2141 domain-containing protein [Alphaproteobacteria bacterium]
MTSSWQIRQRRAMLVAAAVIGVAGSVRAEGEEAGASIPPRLQGLAVSGRALPLVADRIDPGKPLGYCNPANDQPEIRVTIPNLRNSRGNLRISLYGPDADQWVGTKGGKLIRFDVPAQKGEMKICMPLPYGRGIYAVGLYHDENANEKYGFTSEGYGFSNNAKAGLFGPPPHKDAAFSAGQLENDLEIRLRY